MAYCPGRRVNPVSYCIGPVASWCASSSVRVISSRSRTFCNVAPWSSFTSPMTSTVVLATPRRRARVSSCPGILRPLLDQHFIHPDGAIEPRVPRITDVAELGICVCCVVDFYHECRTHLSLDKDAPLNRTAQPPACGTIVAVPHVGGLHHHYERRAA
jgi:hypothetical protein